MHRGLLSPRRRRGVLRGPVGYVLGWVVAGVVLAAVGLVAVGHDGGPDGVNLPPVREVALSAAVRHARCELRALRPVDELSRAQHSSRTRPAAGGAYDRPIASDALGGALRHGVIVVEYRGDLDAGFISQLRTAQRALPAATIVAPAARRSRYAIVATTARRMLGCPRVGPRTLDALRLFRGRFVGERRGP